MSLKMVLSVGHGTGEHLQSDWLKIIPGCDKQILPASAINLPSGQVRAAQLQVFASNTPPLAKQSLYAEGMSLVDGEGHIGGVHRQVFPSKLNGKPLFVEFLHCANAKVTGVTWSGHIRGPCVGSDVGFAADEGAGVRGGVQMQVAGSKPPKTPYIVLHALQLLCTVIFELGHISTAVQLQVEGLKLLPVTLRH